MKYQWSTTGWFGNVDAKVAAEYVESLIEKYNGQLTAELIVTEARHTDSPFHGSFHWNDTKAAGIQRRESARRLVNNITAINKKARTRAFSLVRVPDCNTRVIIATRTAMQDADMRKQVVDQALQVLTRWISRYGSNSDLSFVRSAVERLRKRIEAEKMAATGVHR